MAAVAQFIAAMAGRDAPAFCAHHLEIPTPFQRQAVLPQLFERWAVLMHSTVLQACLHCALKVRGFSWMPARAVMHSLAVPSGGLAATHGGPRL